MHKPILSAAVALLALAAGRVQGQVVLKPRFDEGKYREEQTAKVDQQFKTPVADLSGKSEIEIRSNVEIGKPNADGDVSVTRAIAEFSAKTEQLGAKVEFDSTKPDAKTGDGPVAEAILAIFKRQVEQKPVYTIAADLKVKKVEGLTEGSFSSPAEMQEDQQRSLDALPVEPVAVGQTWERAERMGLGQGQIFKIVRKYEYLGTTPKFATLKDSPLLDKIRMTDLSIELAMREDAGMLVKVKESKLEVAESEGQLLFDRALGRIVETRHKLRVKGKVALEIQNTELSGPYEFSLESLVKEIP